MVQKMSLSQRPVISDEQQLPEINFIVILLSLFLTILLAMSNAYLALKIGILASASIPAAILSMGILKFVKGSNILQNNLVQTAASAGEAVAGGIVYTTPALVLIHYWHNFAYWENFTIALAGGTLGVLFSIPLRRVLVNDRALQFPEGRAIAEVLKASHSNSLGFKEMLLSGLIGALIELCQTGFKIIAHQWQGWVAKGQIVMGFGLGYSPTMIGVGYLIGFRVGFSLFIGAIIGWLFGMPAISYIHGASLTTSYPQQMATFLWSNWLRYVGIGAMLVAGIFTILTLAKPFIASIIDATKALNMGQQQHFASVPRTQRDIPIQYVLVGILVLSLALLALFINEFPVADLHLSTGSNYLLWSLSLFYALIIGFIFSAITGYFSGLVGVTASPGSAIIIAGLIMAAIALRILLISQGLSEDINAKLAASAITIILGAVITSAAAIANDNIQDLKVGQIVGSTPWKQQVMLIFGVAIAAFVIPMVMQLLFKVYGIGDVLPGENMDPLLALPAPPAAMMAAVTQGVFNYDLPWDMLFCGTAVTVLVVVINRLILPVRYRASVLGVAMGIYLPLATSTPLFLGSLLALVSKRYLKIKIYQKQLTRAEYKTRYHRGILLACGLVSGTAIMNILLAIPFVISQDPNILKLAASEWQALPQGLALLTLGAMCFWILRVVCGGVRRA